LCAQLRGSVISGGGFRDSLADMSEELCPSSADTPVPLPFFVRTANQVISPPPPLFSYSVSANLPDTRLS
jgi:hypothetical protein